jgi:regulator of chromosome condensation
LIPELKKIKSLAAGGDHIFALDYRGNIWAWGAGEQGQLGHRVAERRRLEYLVPNRVGLPRDKMEYVASGSYNGFAVDVRGKVWTWGLNNYGQAGVASGAGSDNALVQRPTKVKGLDGYRIKSIEGGSHHSIACTEDGTTLVWGRCDDGQSGIALEKIPEDDIIFDERERPRILTKPTVVPGIKSVAVAAGIDNCIAVTTDGQAYSWGFSESYRTGQGTTDSIKEATLIDNTATRGKKLTFAGCGGQFSVLAGPMST